MLSRVHSALIIALSTLGSAWIFALMLLICGDIAGRVLFNTPIQRTPELVALSVPCVVFLQLPRVVSAGRMIHADLILRVIEARAPFAGHCYGLLFAVAGVTVFGVILLWTVPDLAKAIRIGEFAGTEGAYAVTVWPFKLAVVIGAAFAALSFVGVAAAHLKGLFARRSPGDGARSGARFGWIALSALAVLILSYVGVNFLGHLQPTHIGLISVLGMLLLLLAGMPIGTALVVLSFIGIWLIRGNETIAVNATGLAASSAISSYDFAVIPLYVLMGLLVEKAEVGRDAFAVAAALLRRVRGGLGMATVLANALFASITGSSIASATVFARICVPEMVGHGYSKRFSVGTVAGSSVLGMLIPPSILLIVYGLVSEVSIGKLFIAAVIPGLILAAAFMLMISLVAKFWPGFVGNPKAIAEVPHMSARASLIALLPMIVLIGVVMGGIYGGVMTPTESGAVGALGALVIAISRRKLPWSELAKVLTEAGLVTGAILFLIVAASLYSRMLALSGIPTFTAGLVSEAGLGMASFLVIYLLVILLLGMILDSVSIMLMVLPVMLPIVTALGGNLVWFGVLTTISVEIGLLTPPFGISVFVVNSTLPKGFAHLREIFEGALPFVLTMMAVTVLVAAFPILATVIVR